MIIKKLVLGAIETNCYIICAEGQNHAILIDPADSANHIKEALKELNLDLCAILLTHGHFDHILAVREFQNENIKLYASEDERKLLADANMNASAMVHRECTLVPNVVLHDGEQFEIAGIKLKVISTPGHTRGSICLYIEEAGVLFSGDTLFKESMGRTDLPTGNGHLLIESIRDKLFVLPDEVIVYPGHGEETSIGYEKRNNPFIYENERWSDNW